VLTGAFVTWLHAAGQARLVALHNEKGADQAGHRSESVPWFPAPRANFGRRTVQMGLVHVTDRSSFDSLQPHQLMQILAPHHAATEKAKHHPIICALTLREDTGV